MKVEVTKFWTRFIDEKKMSDLAKRKRGLIYVFTGDGEGKTTAALGMGLRALGHGKSVVVIQFMKGRKYIGEYQVQGVLKNYEIYQFGKEQFVDLSKPNAEDKKLAKEGLEFAESIIKKRPDVLILDEINVAISCGLIKINDLLKLLKSVPHDMIVLVTGRSAHKDLIKLADVVSEIKNVKHFFDFGSFAKKGQQF